MLSVGECTKAEVPIRGAAVLFLQRQIPARQYLLARSGRAAFAEHIFYVN
jgi:hypothetical protein